jgi:hypothetical protein
MSAPGSGRGGSQGDVSAGIKETQEGEEAEIGEWGKKAMQGADMAL